MLVDYQALLDESMLSLIQKVLITAQEQGLGDDQSFYISFHTDLPEVVLSKRVKQLYPEEITIVLQYQFKNLMVLPDLFSVNIAFSGISETIEVPFHAITSFIDPIANFSIQLRHTKTSKAKNIIHPIIMPKPTLLAKNKELSKKSGEVIAINTFPKKQK